MNDFDFLHGTWTVHHRRLRDRMVGSDDWETNWVMRLTRVADATRNR